MEKTSWFWGSKSIEGGTHPCITSMESISAVPQVQQGPIGYLAFFTLQILK